MQVNFEVSKEKTSRNRADGVFDWCLSVVILMRVMCASPWQVFKALDTNDNGRVSQEMFMKGLMVSACLAFVSL